METKVGFWTKAEKTRAAVRGNGRGFESRAWLFAVLFLACLIGAGCKKAPPPAAPPPTVEVFKVTATNAPAGTEIIGKLDSPENVEVRARVEAFVDKMLFTEGTEVKEGDVL
ncbi:MAG TPA: hypothetical protein VN794_21300, partial [Methylomirabilota bacterium]|nr:hypothetical protein [Methylomirabilota bacterium]